MITKSLAKLHERAKGRPAGYIDDVLGQAESVDQAAGTYRISPERFAALKKKYRAASEPDRGEWGPKKWKELHTLMLAMDANPSTWLATIVIKLAMFWATLPCGECKTGWQEIVKRSPPPMRPGGLFAWSVDRHNEVNAKLKKPTMTVEQATKIYSQA